MNEPTLRHNADRCDQQQLDQFLNSDHYRIEDSELIEHLDSCVECRTYLDQQAAAPDLWQKTGCHLKPTEFDMAGSPDCSAATVDHFGRTPVAVQDVLDKLAPTEDPHHLGRLGSYEVTGVVGVGGMGVVLKAIDPSLDRVVAVKVMAPQLAGNEKARKRFSREAKAAAAVIHPNVIPIHSVSSEDTLPYLVMAYIRGGSLQKRLELEGSLSTIEVLRIGSQVAAGLVAAHEQGLVHRDIKPENILMEEGIERITITDFGLARAVDDNTVTQLGTIAGTPRYMSPEQARGEQLDQTSDLFSLGSVLYALCTGHPPFQADTSYGVMRMIIDEEPTSVQESNPNVSAWLAKLIAKLMAKDKSQRFESAEEVHKLLEQCLSQLQQKDAADLEQMEFMSQVDWPTPAKPTKTDSPVSDFGLRKWAAIAIATSLLIAAGLYGFFQLAPMAGWITTQQDSEPDIQLNSSVNNDDDRSKSNSDNDEKEIIGTWQVTYVEDGGRVAPLETPDGQKLDAQIVFNAESMKMVMDGRTNEGAFSLDPSTSPKSIDLTENGQTKLGIYDLQGDTLRICISEKTDARPTAFDSQPDSPNDLIFLLKRVPDEESSEQELGAIADGEKPSAKYLRGLIPEAASISYAEFRKLTNDPNPNAVDNQSFSMVFLTLPDAKDDAEEEELEILAESLRPSDLASVMSRSRSKGYATLIQPEFIDECKIDLTRGDEETVYGHVEFWAPKLYKGNVEFRARKLEGEWKIDQFLLPIRKIRVELNDEGVWILVKEE